MHKRASTASRRPWERRRMEVKVVDVTKGVFLLLFFYPQILSQLGERCVLCISRNIMPAADAQTTGGLEKGNMRVSMYVWVCVRMHAQWQLAEEVRHAFGHMGHGARLASQFLEVKVRTASTKMCHHQFLKAKEEEASDSKNSISFWGPRIGGSRDVRGKKICGILREIYRRKGVFQIAYFCTKYFMVPGFKIERKCVCLQCVFIWNHVFQHLHL